MSPPSSQRGDHDARIARVASEGPDANLRAQLDLARAIVGLVDGQLGEIGEMAELAERAVLAERLAELVLDLAEWRATGGFDPDRLPWG